MDLKIESGLDLFRSGVNYNDSPIIANAINVLLLNGEGYILFDYSLFLVNDNESVEQFVNFVNSLIPGTVVIIVIPGALPLAAINNSTKILESFSVIGAHDYKFYYPDYSYFCSYGYKGQPANIPTPPFQAKHGIATPGNPVKIETDLWGGYSDSIDFIDIHQSLNHCSLMVNGRKFNFLKDGLNIGIFDQNLKCLTKANFNSQNPDDSSLAKKYLQSVEGSSIILLITSGDPTLSKGLFLMDEELRSLVRTLGCKFIDNFLFDSFPEPNNRWAAITQKGRAIAYAEATNINLIKLCYIFQTSVKSGTKLLSLNSRNSEWVSSNRECQVALNDTRFQYPNPNTGFFVKKFDEVVGISEMSQVYDGSPESIIELSDMIKNTSPGTFVLITLSRVPDTFQMTSSFSNALKSIGSCCYSNITATSSYVLMGRKGAVIGSVPEMISNENEKSVSLFSNSDLSTGLVKPFLDIKSIASNGIFESRFMINGRKVDFENKIGMNCMVIDVNDGSISHFKHFEISDTTDDFGLFIESLSIGSLVAFSSKGATSNIFNQRAKHIITQSFRILDTSSNQDLNSDKLYCAIGQKLSITKNNMIPLFCESTSSFSSHYSSTNDDNDTISCSLRYPLKYLFHNVTGISVNVSSKGGNDIPTASIVLNGRPIIGGQNSETNPCDGLNVVVWDNKEEKHTVYKYNVSVDGDEWLTFYSMIKSLSIGTIVLVAVQRGIGNFIVDDGLQFYRDSAFSMIGGCHHNYTNPQSSYSIIGIKGTTSSALESHCNRATLVSISSWEPFKGANGETFQLDGQNNDHLSIPLFRGLQKLVNPIPSLSKSKAFGHIYSIAPALSCKAPMPRVNGVPRKRALIVSLSYSKSYAGKLKDTDQIALLHAQALFGCKYINGVEDKIKILSDNVTLSNQIPSFSNVESEIKNWLLQGVEEGDVLYFAFIGRGFNYNALNNLGFLGGLVFSKGQGDETGFTNKNKLLYLFEVLESINYVNLSFLFDCDHSYNIGAPNHSTAPVYKKYANVFTSLGENITKKLVTQGLGYMENFNFIINRHYSDYFDQKGLTPWEIYLRMLSNGLYMGNLDPQFLGKREDNVFLSH
ncbi:hypothetical protein CYY_003854 [Polysphondylium violaceum]|uniref:ILEI/PANDER domain-containing protein n=1 Tax=Polysphondylium violaceum TaxID=133409 RepID=A0A8J4PZ26_9MYCE|nr:hypothetical protein CYY_003854 [Polysphondylium violaceum]